MNILHLTKDFIHLNGISTFIKSLIPNDWNNNHFVASNFIVAEFRRTFNINIIEHILPVKTSQLLPNILRIIKICKANKIDVIHSHHRYYDLLAYFVSNVYSIKTITTVHSKVFGKKKLSYKADKIVVVSKSIKQHLMKYYKINENRITLINNFIDPKQIKLTENKRTIITELHLENKFIIGFVGRFDIKEKGIDMLIKAIPKVVANSKDVIFLLIGEGIVGEYLVINTENNAENVRIIKTRPDIHNYMQVFDLFILPSRIDPFPLVMLEAAYLKIPFIGSRVDGIAEFVNDGEDGILFESENANELADKIIELVNNKSKRVNFADKAFEKLIANYTVDQKLKDYQKIYSTIVNEKNFT